MVDDMYYQNIKLFKLIKNQIKMSKKHKHLESMSQLEKAGYKGIKVTSILKACLSVEIKQHLKLVQLDELTKIDNKYFKQGYISKAEMTLVWNIYWNFVLNDFRFNNGSLPTMVTSTNSCDESHIGIRMLNDLNLEESA